MLEKTGGSTFEKIRPKEVLESFLKLVAKDLQKDRPTWRYETLDSCPACESRDITRAFEKWEETYSRCGNCASLFMNPRPTVAELNAFYEGGESSTFWSETYYPSVAENRRVSVYRKRAEYAQTIFEAHSQKGCIVDIGTGFGIFLEELKRCNESLELVGVEPYAPFAEEARARRIKIVDKWLEGLEPTDFPSPVHLITLFEVAEHLQNPLLAFKKVADLLQNGGLLFFTTLGADGFDVLELGEAHENIYPPCHINIFSQQGYENLLKFAGFRMVEFKTPGILDVAIVKRAYAERRIPSQGFIHSFLQSADDKASSALQNFLQESKRSSHVWIVAQKI